MTSLPSWFCLSSIARFTFLILHCSSPPASLFITSRKAIMAGLRNALIVGLAVGSTVFAGVSSASAEGSETLGSASAGSVIKGADQFNAAGELVGGSEIFPAGVSTRNGDAARFVVAAEEVGGGTWDRGTNLVKGWSNYIHPDKNHGATSRQGSRSDSSDKGPRLWADTSVNRDIFDSAPIEAFWRVS
ncbi:lactococcin 972 family bacteriocin [Lentzea sp. NPDC051208]|uniref:lactococcin 972 family bacteriocin n=1 Tax=Lentzea sp. NPDC051208 TaxID=3154642 RepID=UPI0034437417